MNPTVVEEIPTAAWREAVATALGDGARFAGAWLGGSDERPAWHALVLPAGGGRRVLWCEAPGRRVASIADFAPAGWDEREAHDLHGVTLEGNPAPRSLVDHTPDLGRWTTPVVGDGVHQVAVGPIHAGVIESGHFRFHVVGERILALDPRLFYKHRGLERAAAGRDVDAALPYVRRACAACAVANSLAYAHAVEDALGLAPDPALQKARTVLLELERLYNHLHDIDAICAGVGFAPGTMAFATMKDRAQRVAAALTGHRFMFGAVAVGGGAVSVGADAAADARARLRELRADAAAAWRDLEFAGSLQARLDGIGVLSREDALRLGAVGPAARASGVRDDARIDSPRLWYGGFSPAVLPDPAGDVAARLRMRALELETTFDVLDELLARRLPPGRAGRVRDPVMLGVGRVESARGATTCAVELDPAQAGQRTARVTRVRLRTASYANWPALAHAVAGDLLPDFPLVNKSFELCYACVDR